MDKLLRKDVNLVYKEWEEYGRISQEASKDFLEKKLALSKELRNWVIQISVIGAAIIGAVVSFSSDRHNPLIIEALIFLIISIVWGLFHIKNILENQIILLHKEDLKFQEMIHEVRKACMNFVINPNKENKSIFEEIKDQKVKELSSKPEIKITKDKNITAIFILFTVSLLDLLLSLFF